MLKYPLGKPKRGSVKYSHEELTTDPKIARKCFEQMIGIYVEYTGTKKLEDFSDEEILKEMKNYLAGAIERNKKKEPNHE